MYEQHFGFREPPFRITPDPRFLYRNHCVEEAAAALAYGIERRKGFLSLVGEAGTGKTTLLRHVLDTLSGNVRTVLLLHPTVEFDEILEYILTELGIPVEGGRKLALLQRLQEFLLENTRAGGNVALLIDEAQDLEARVLEELRLLSNLETGTEKILQIVLAGQPELEAKLGDPALRQLRQRIALHIRLRPLSPEEVAAYVHTRLERAGAARSDIFTPAAIAHVANVSGGIPRVVNVLCDACLVTAYATGSQQVNDAIVSEAWADYSRLVGDQPAPPASTLPPPRPIPFPTTAPSPPTAPPPVVETAAPPVEAPRVAALPAAVPTLPNRTTIADRVPEPEPDDGPLPTAPWTFSSRDVATVIVGVLLVLAVNQLFLRGGSLSETDRVAPPTPVFGVAPGGQPAAVLTAPTPPEARALVHEFLLAYEARDAGRVANLFAPDATDGAERGTSAIRASYERTFADLADVLFAVPRIDTIPRGERLSLTGPVVITYLDKTGTRGARRGTAEWEIVRRDGIPRITRLQTDVTDTPTAPTT
jgi:general secretion pathway protein A